MTDIGLPDPVEHEIEIVPAVEPVARAAGRTLRDVPRVEVVERAA